MNINPKYLIYHDVIGLNATAKHKSKQRDANFSDIGMVIDESANMLITEKEKEIKKYVKKDYIFRFKIPESDNNSKKELLLEVNGEKIVGTPDKRLRHLKKRRRIKR